MNAVFLNGSLQTQTRDIPLELIGSNYTHVLENGNIETYRCSHHRNDIVVMVLASIDFTVTPHGNGFIFGNDKRTYPTKAYRLVDMVTGEPQRIGKYSNTVTTNRDDALQALAKSSRCILEVIECYELVE